jgi:hypothetical protein
MASGSSPREIAALNALVNLEVAVSAKKRALARRTGSLGSNSPSGAISAINSRRTPDSAILWEVGEGASGATSGPP